NEPPGGNGEEVGRWLVLAAALGLLPFALGLARGFRSLQATRRAERELRAHARPLSLPEAELPVARMDQAFPVAALWGFFRPRLYLADTALLSFTPGELRVTCAHERAHAASHDNLKSLLLRASPDWLSLIPLGATIERAWAEATEQAADDVAVSGDAGRRVDLAAALVKVARLVPPGMRLADSYADFLHGSFLHGGALSTRVARLLEAPTAEDGSSPTAWVLAACLAALLAPLAAPHSSRMIYELLERALHLAT
ncbi:MAG: M56 family metallopeptidase, partial [Thermoanaerobaculia bacterium]